MTEGTGRAWSIVLAGGEGRRLGEMARERYGYARPKQFCAFGGGATLVEDALGRALRASGSPDRMVVSVSGSHRSEVEECLSDWPNVARVEQPSNRDTAPGLLLPLLHVLARDREAMVFVFPSDHRVSDDGRFVMALRHASRALEDDELAMLGAELDHPEDDLGWIVPVADDLRAVPRVAAFVEKPSAAELALVWRSGALANTFAMVGRGTAFARLFWEHAPRWWAAVSQSFGDPGLLDEVYRRLPPCNLSTEVLQRSVRSLRVARLAGVQWSDIGTPARLERVLVREGAT